MAPDDLIMFHRMFSQLSGTITGAMLSRVSAVGASLLQTLTARDLKAVTLDEVCITINFSSVDTDPASRINGELLFWQTSHGGYDDIAFKGNAIYLSASNPAAESSGNVAGPSICAGQTGADHTVAVTPLTYCWTTMAVRSSCWCT